ncbi:MAG: hypoxanthine phosphoribosyltransferase [Saprospiraceae bacterium]|nr:hypoxanthine phosphoribosyltransferase [Bacteroidia bacterium]NNL91447.1 hypoxanthine phosphoribosyltransferase [Saprospiraceae bacterium]
MDIITYNEKVFSPFLSKEEIDGIVGGLATQINADYSDIEEDVVLVSILDGSFIFMADLVRKLTFQFEVEFVKIRSYNGFESEGEIELILDLHKDIKGKHIIVIEDIVDTGLTIEKFIEQLQALNPKSVKVCSLLSKPDVHNDIINIDYVGKEIPPVFVIGYGLDIDGKGRNHHGIYQLEV